jgi:hypothetical protein
MGSYTWVTVDDDSKLLAVALMMLAATYDNRIPCDPEFIKQVACLRKLPDLTPLISTQFIEIIDASGNLVQYASKVYILRQNDVPETETETYKPEKKNPSTRKARGETDPRFSQAKEFIEKCCKHAKVPFVWNGAEAKQLSEFLKATPALTVEEVLELIRARFRSEEPPGNRPCLWLPKLSSYATGPLDRFHNEAKPKVNGASVGVNVTRTEPETTAEQAEKNRQEIIEQNRRFEKARLEREAKRCVNGSQNGKPNGAGDAGMKAVSSVLPAVLGSVGMKESE